ncbi:peptide chain release factor 1 [Porphyromonadaceae bacterium W3.11]|nr:peptide chain release factor 1 [Porphyromonadaceae bacterium W3.11]
MSDTFDILARTSGLKERFQEVQLMITDPEVINDQKRFRKLSKEYSELEKVVAKSEEYARLKHQLDEVVSMADTERDPEMRKMIYDEIEELREQVPGLENEIKLLLIPADPEDDKNAIIEIRGGTGGDEAALFAGDLYKMYSRYCESQGWKTSITSFNEGTMGGFKEIVFSVEGDGVYGKLKYESGVHRVQRVPQTETQGRIHTSAATVAVLPEADEFDVEVREQDIRVDTYNSSGAGGQSVNTTYSAVRLTHIPTGIVVQSQDERSQIKNKARAMTELRTRIYNMEYQKYIDEIASKRKTLVSTGDRSAKIRTYHFPQGRVTDHRIGLTLHQLDDVLNGDIQPFIDALTVAENAERMNTAQL